MEADARAALASIIKASMTGQRPATVHSEKAIYACKECWGWHLTSKPYENEIVQRELGLHA